MVAPMIGTILRNRAVVLVASCDVIKYSITTAEKIKVNPMSPPPKIAWVGLSSSRLGISLAFFAEVVDEMAFAVFGFSIVSAGSFLLPGINKPANALLDR